MRNKQLVERQYLNFKSIRKDLFTTKYCKLYMRNHKSCICKIYIFALPLTYVIVAF